MAPRSLSPQEGFLGPSLALCSLYLYSALCFSALPLHWAQSNSGLERALGEGCDKRSPSPGLAHLVPSFSYPSPAPSPMLGPAG